MGNTIQVRCISLWQPWASAVALGLKRIETRGWGTGYRGTIAIHAAKKKSAENRALFAELLEDREIFNAFKFLFLDYDRLPYGAVVAVADLADCVPVDRIPHLDDLERMLGNFEAGRFGWMLQNVRPLAEPVAAAGRQGFFFARVPEDLRT